MVGNSNTSRGPCIEQEDTGSERTDGARTEPLQPASRALPSSEGLCPSFALAGGPWPAWHRPVRLPRARDESRRRMAAVRRLRLLASHSVPAATGSSDGRQLRVGEREREYVLDVLDNEFRTSGNSKYNSLLETAFAARFGAHASSGKEMFGIGHQNGTATMHTALWAAGLRAGDEVIVPPLTMSSTAICVLHNGCVPVFADVNARSFNIDAESIRKVITPRTKAVITVSLYGLCPDYDPIVELCKEHGIVLIEDNAECFLGEYKGRLVGTIGDYSSFSFQASKHMTCGEGGMLLVKDQEQADLARRFCCLGYGSTSATKQKFTKQEIQSPDYNRHCQLGWNYRMSELQAAVALAQLERLDELVLCLLCTVLVTQSVRGSGRF